MSAQYLIPIYSYCHRTKPHNQNSFRFRWVFDRNYLIKTLLVCSHHLYQYIHHPYYARLILDHYLLPLNIHYLHIPRYPLQNHKFALKLLSCHPICPHLLKIYTLLLSSLTICYSPNVLHLHY